MPSVNSSKERHAAYMRAWRKYNYLHGHRLVPVEHATRRIRAMQCMGWSHRDITTAMGYEDRLTLSYILEQKSVSKEMLAKIDKVYRDLAFRRRPMPASGHERSRVTLTLNHAKREGFIPAMAWDDIDNLDERPKGLRRGTRADTRLRVPNRRLRDQYRSAR